MEKKGSGSGNKVDLRHSINTELVMVNISEGMAVLLYSVLRDLDRAVSITQRAMGALYYRPSCPAEASHIPWKKATYSSPGTTGNQVTSGDKDVDSQGEEWDFPGKNHLFSLH